LLTKAGIHAGTERLLDEYPDDPAAWDGRGSVLAVRGDLEVSLPYFEEALGARSEP
jgi:hypothetical protein